MATAMAMAWASLANAQEPSSISGRQAIDLLVGNTAVVTLAVPSKGAQDGKLHLRHDGTAVWVNVERDARPVSVDWHQNDREELCLEGLPKGFQIDGCALIEISNDRIVMRLGSTSSEGHLVIRLEQGNPYNL